MKKVLAAALLCAVSSFATWDYFPAKPAGKGEVKVGVDYVTNDPGYLSIPFGARYSIIEGLEAALMWGYGVSDPSGLDQLQIGARYWLPMGLGFFLDVGVPIDDGQNLFFHLGPQYSTKINEALVIGSEVGVNIGLEDGDTKYTPPMMLNVGAEADYTIGSITPFVALDFTMGLTESKVDMPSVPGLGGLGDLLGGLDLGDVGGAGVDGYKPDPDLDVTIGAIYEINEMLSADASVTLGGLLSDGDMGIIISAHVSVNF